MPQRPPKKIRVTVRSLNFEMTYEVEVAKATPELLKKFEDAHGVMVHHFGLDQKVEG